MTWALLITLMLPAMPIDVWLDADTATGVGDVDDGLMMIQCFHSPELTVRGVSVVFGNTTLEQAVPIAREITSRFGPKDMPIAEGAGTPAEVERKTEAVRAMASALEQRPLTILAVGPVTNVAALLTHRPDLAPRIQQVVMVAARRPGQRFATSSKQRIPHPDANFEKDPAAMRRVLESNIPLVFAPWEVSSHVWISRDDLRQMNASGASGEWIARTSPYWIELWEAEFDDRGFNPFDTLAAGWLTHPAMIESEPVDVRITEDLDDRGSGERKPYLLVGPAGSGGRRAVYCARPKPAFHDILIQRLIARPDR